MAINLFEHQQKAVDQLKTGSILCGGVGTGKTITSLAYYYTKECGGKIDQNNIVCSMTKPKNLYVITTAGKRDTLDWEREAALFGIATKSEFSICGVVLKVDSWNNIKKYEDEKNAFFIFDEQRVIGSGSWVKSFLKIVKKNNWILLSATPGDTWMDYIPVFIANGFYKNRTEFLRKHVVYNNFSKFPKIDHYVETRILEKYKADITVIMEYQKLSEPHYENIIVDYDKALFDKVWIDKWNVFENRPIKNITEYCYIARRVVNTDSDRLARVNDLVLMHRKLIVFYNFNYELDDLRLLNSAFLVAEYNGHKHEPVPQGECWVYLVHYLSGAEGWNCIETNALLFYSMNYSYRLMTQAAGRIDRLTTPFSDLYYYTLKTTSPIDRRISKSLANKEDFNDRSLIKNFRS